MLLFRVLLPDKSDSLEHTHIVLMAVLPRSVGNVSFPVYKVTNVQEYALIDNIKRRVN